VNKVLFRFQKRLISLPNLPFPNLERIGQILIICDDVQYRSGPLELLFKNRLPGTPTFHFWVVTADKKFPDASGNALWFNDKAFNFLGKPKSPLLEKSGQIQVDMVINMAQKHVLLAQALALSLPQIFHVQMNNADPYGHLVIVPKEPNIQVTVQRFFDFSTKIKAI
jgi:hypothetical protein